MALRLWAASTANALKISCATKSQLSISRCFSSVLDGLKYAESHEWVKHEGSVATIGITDHAQDHLGEVVFVDLPEPGGSVSKGKGFGAVESVKATSDVNSPISGEIVEVNSKLTEAPGLGLVHISTYTTKWIEGLFCTNRYNEETCQINSSPYEEGWMIKVKPSSSSELDSLMGPKEYTKFCEEEDASH